MDDVEWDPALASRVRQLDHAVAAMAEAPEFAKPAKLQRLLDALRRVLIQDGGPGAVRDRAEAIERSGLFGGSDWAHPEILVPALVGATLRSGNTDAVVLEATSELRMVAIADGDYTHPDVSADDARRFLSQILALNLELLIGAPSEADRIVSGRTGSMARKLFAYLVEQIGYGSVLDELVEEIWRVLKQRPIQVDQVKAMVAQISVHRNDPDTDTGSSGQGLDRLITALFGPTEGCREDPGIEVYLARVEAMDTETLEAEARGFARAMHDTGLVSAYHATLILHLLESNASLLPETLGLSDVGRTSLLRYADLVHELIRRTVSPANAQCLYGLALLLDRGILHQPPVAPSLWRQLSLKLARPVRERLHAAFGPAVEPEALLLGGLLSMLGQPLGVGQGDNPTCQSARALSMWAYNDPDYLLQVVAWSARDDEMIAHFEGHPISSAELSAGVAATAPIDLDPVSLLTVPHLDRIYAEMIRLCADRPGDPHRWVNPEFHGWWSARGFRINVDVATGDLVDPEGFVRQFYAAYHPDFNGNQPLIHPQPAGIAFTDSGARYIGWHAITVLRVAPDPTGTIRAYFFNPNNDSGQDWGDGVVVGTAGNGERPGEGSLPFEQFASRLYIFHADPLEDGAPDQVPADAIARVLGYIARSWGAGRGGYADLHVAP